MNNSKYDILVLLHEKASTDSNPSVLAQVPNLLNNWGIKCREDDGTLLSINLSVPQSVGETIAIGLRYQKKDATFTEDLFTVSSSSPNIIDKHYKASQEKVFPEYEGTHKEQKVNSTSFTSVNTCSYIFPTKEIS
jgi:hypothetical protein